MKKVLSILIVALVLLSGMHLSLANHICGGKIVATKVSFDKEKASCGMANDFSTESNIATFKTNCCHDKISSFMVDNQYQPVSFELKKSFSHIISEFLIPANSLLLDIHNSI